MTVKRGEIYFVNLNPVQGREQGGQRPVLVISNDSINRLPLVVTVVVGTKGQNVSRDYPTNVRISAVDSGLSLETVFLCFQICSLDIARFPDSASGQLEQEQMQRIDAPIRYCLSL